MANGPDHDLRQRFGDLARRWWPVIANQIDEEIDRATMKQSLLRRMAHYHLNTGGKRVRAILPLLVAETLGTDPLRLVPFGAACEMLHNASLVHDDIQDGDILRRGQPAVWKEFGLAQAVNLGDAMIACAVLLMHRLEVKPELRERIVHRMFLEVLRVIEGQVQDLDLKSRLDVTLEAYLRMVEGKTSRLFALPLSGAAMLCDAGDDVEQALVEAASHIGVLYQVQDDLVDHFKAGACEAEGGDIHKGKLTVMAAHCLNTVGAEKVLGLKDVLHRLSETTDAADVVAVTTLYEEAGSVAFALAELDRRRLAALSVPGLTRHPSLITMLAEAWRHVPGAGPHPVVAGVCCGRRAPHAWRRSGAAFEQRVAATRPGANPWLELSVSTQREPRGQPPL
jgi:geranylgeranyl diphosphate synthase, type I